MAKKKYSMNKRQATKKSKLLNETQVRRFMGLAGLQPLREGGLYEEPMPDDEMAPEDDMGGEEEPLPDDMGGEEEPLPDDEMGGEEGTKEISQDMVDDAAEALSSLQELVDALGGAADVEGEEEPMPDDMDMDMGGEEEPMPEEEPLPDEEMPEEEEEVMQEALRGVNVQLSENEVVKEVARRVAKRILKAKQAQAKLDEALGNKKPTRRTRRTRRTRKK